MFLRFLYLVFSMVLASIKLVLNTIASMLKEVYYFFRHIWNKIILLNYNRTINSNKHTYEYLENGTSNFLYQKDNLEKNDTLSQLSELDKDIASSLDCLPKNSYRIINRVRKENNKKELDHIVISQFGIFVIDSSDSTGRIYGTNTSLNWSVYGKDIKKSQTCENKNYSNIKKIEELARLISCPKKYFKSVVVFNNDANLFFVNNDNIININKLLENIYKYKRVIISRKSVKRISLNILATY